MYTELKSLDISTKIGVSTHTIRRWVLKYPEYFSEGARRPFRNQPLYSTEDLTIILTIKELTKQGYGLNMIGYKLAEGYRYEGSLEDFQKADPEPKANKKKTGETLEERLVEVIEKQEAAFLERITELTSELMQTKHKLGVAEGQLEAIKTYLIKPT